MGTYATTTSFVSLLSQFYKNNDSTFDASGKTAVGVAILRAEATVNAALARRYSLPFASVPPEVSRITEDIASYYLIRSSHWQSSGNEKNAYLEEFKTAFDDLKAIANGDQALADSTGSIIEINSAGLYVSSQYGNKPIFDVDEPEAWNVDEDRLTTIEGERS